MNDHRWSMKKWLWPLFLGVVTIGGLATYSSWLPGLSAWAKSTVTSFRTSSPEKPTEQGQVAAPSQDHSHGPQDSEANHSHAPPDQHAGHSESAALELSAQALRNIGLTRDQLAPIRLQAFEQSHVVPALVVERPGQTHMQVAAPMTGVITHIHGIQGEALEPGAMLFQIRLTHEDLVRTQSDFLKLLGELDVEEREIERLTGVTQSGAVARKVLLNRQYEKDKLLAQLRAQREALRLHGLSQDHVTQIERERRLLRQLQVFVPSPDKPSDDSLKLTRQAVNPVEYEEPIDQKNDSNNPPLILQELNVHVGQSVQAGETLCVLANYRELYVEGRAFEQDIPRLRKAADENWTVTAVFDQKDIAAGNVTGLEIAYLSNEVDVESRTLRFYVRLPNEITGVKYSGENRFVSWKYRPGQRLQLQVPVDRWEDQIVLPVEAVVNEGAEYYVFQQNGKHFDRVPVHVTHRDQFHAVIANDGSLFPGDVVAMRGAHQMQMALKNKSTGGVDPHAGHSH